ncbi:MULTISPECIES: TRAP transporter small permease subunit [Thermus]|jgi:TRAP-type mannitol/chloroaromatic compound transport system permease small subunit|uniref:C4-dicarboxylate ABC transporter substrate-binding protein n=1 Tax=Thermus brockianus TaxID=56956 RepID=A0A1J0LSQ8_THEBO|nr:TRAP transporter small permease subunit [Thermus brockianus]APD09358.1 tripartite transporter small subunit [Thermus brockianus]BDG17379.1 C4-dicarboxylate ABC transporter substrate-binding protein [Thermus brockianus]
MRFLLGLSRAIDALTAGVGRLVVWLVLLVALLSAGNAILRYGFNYSSNAYLEAQWYMFSLIFLLGGAYALKHNAHVRIDLLFGRFSRRTQAWIDVVGTVLFLLPMALGVLYLAWPWAMNSLAIREMSPDVGGLPRWPIKLAVVLGFALLLLQGVSELIKRIAFLTGHRPTPWDEVEKEVLE